jgi:zinc transporter ZupT
VTKAVDGAPTGVADRVAARGSATRWIFGLLPLVFLAILITLLLRLDSTQPLRAGTPTVEDLTIDRVVLTEEPRTVLAVLVNGGPARVTVGQVLVDKAFWPFEVDPAREIEPLGSATVTLAYPWVHGEPLELVILTSTGLTFGHTIDFATSSPTLDAATMADLARVGVFVGLLPVLIGMCWYPFVRRVGRDTARFLLALTAGVLVFLAVDATIEAINLAPSVPTAFRGLGIFVVAVVVAFTLIVLIGASIRRRLGDKGISLALTIALGVGLHNMGEGMAIGAAYALGEVTLTTLLIVGFALHNSTEGLAIVSPLAEARTRLVLLVGLGLVAGVPTIPGTWVGALAFSPGLAIAFLGLGVGAVLQVIVEVCRLITRDGALAKPSALGGFAAGVALMYATAVFIAV